VKDITWPENINIRSLPCRKKWENH
jgi:hypothetical protein